MKALEKKSLNILYLINSLEMGGAEVFLMRLIKELQSSYNVNAFLLELVPSKDKKFKAYFLEETLVKVIPVFEKNETIVTTLLWKLNAVTWKMLRWPFYQNFRDHKKKSYYRNFIQSNNIHLINSHLLGADLFVCDYLKTFISVPWVATSQGCYSEITSKETARNIAQRMDGLTYVAARNLNIFNENGIELTPNRALIYNGLNYRDIKTKDRKNLHIRETDFVIGQISRSIPSKGLEISITAVDYLVQTNGLKDVKLVLFGPENNYYLELKEKHKNKQYILFPGVADNSVEWTGIFDLGILPTYFPSESCPSTIVEYLAAGVPAISTNVGEIPNMIQSSEGDGGVIISETDAEGLPDAQSFAIEILKFYQDSALLELTKKNAVQAFEKFDISKTAKSYLEVYHRAIKNNVEKTS